MRNQKDKSLAGGFTLIELLVVIAIITTLMSLIAISYSDARARSRDARRVTDVKSLRDALALYQVHYTSYPIKVEQIKIDGSGGDIISSNLISEGILPAVIKDPSSPTYDYTYQSTASGSSYIIRYCLETDSVMGMQKGCGHFVEP